VVKLECYLAFTDCPGTQPVGNSPTGGHDTVMVPRNPAMSFEHRVMHPLEPIVRRCQLPGSHYLDVSGVKRSLVKVHLPSPGLEVALFVQNLGDKLTQLLL